MFRDRYVKCAGLRLHIVEWGSPSADPVILVHGLNGHAHNWDPVAREMASAYHVICPDLRGHGDSDWALDGYWYSSFAHDLHAVAQELGLNDFDMVGHSLGCRIAIAFAGLFPTGLRHLALSDTGPEMPRSGAQQVQGRAGANANVRGFRSRDEVIEYTRTTYPGWADEFYELHATYNYRVNWTGKLVPKPDPDLFWITGSASLKQVPDLWKWYRSITVPTLVMWGTKSPLLDSELVDRMLSELATARLSKFDTGHYIPFEQPAEFTTQLVSFLRDEGD